MEYRATQAPDGRALNLVRLAHACGTALDIMDWGATWLSCRVPLADGTARDVILGCGCLADFFTQQAFLGATIGRYANRIAGATIEHGGKTWRLDANQQDRHQLHGGSQGFDKRRWTIAEQSHEHARFELLSADGDQGFPGNLEVCVTYRLKADRVIRMECEAVTDQPTPIALTNHSYFNLDGGKSDARRQGLQIQADLYAPVDDSLIPLGALAGVADSGFDFRSAKPIAQHLLQDAQQQIAGGYDHAWLLDARCADMSRPAAVLCSGDGQLSMALHTTMPALQFYSGNFLADTPAREGGVYAKFGGVALEPGVLPDSPHHPEWPQPSCWLMPGETYRQVIEWRFS